MLNGLTTTATTCHTKGCDSLSLLKGRYDETFAGLRLLFMGCRFSIYSLFIDIHNSFMDIIHLWISKVIKGAKIKNQYTQVPHLTQDTNGKVTDSQLDTTNESHEGSPFIAGEHKAHININISTVILKTNLYILDAVHTFMNKSI